MQERRAGRRHEVKACIHEPMDMTPLIAEIAARDLYAKRKEERNG